MKPVTDSRRLTYAWAVLSIITVGTWWLGHDPTHRSADAAVAIAILVLVIAVVKSRLIIRHFMEVRIAPRWLKIFTDGWLIALAGVLVGSFAVLYLR